jgi:hypothetical protein
MARRDTQITWFCMAVGPWSGRILGEQQAVTGALAHNRR